MAPFFYLVPAWLSGIFLQGWLTLPVVWLWFALVGCLALACFGYWKLALTKKTVSTQETANKYPLLDNSILLISRLSLCIVALSLGGLRYDFSQPSTGPESILYYVDQPNLRVTGVVVDDPVYTAKTDSYRLRVQQVLLNIDGANATKVEGEVFVRTSLFPERKPGDLLELQGTLKFPKEIEGDGFPYRDYLARQGLYVTLDYPHASLLGVGQDQKFFLLAWLQDVRDGARNIIKANLPGDEGDLLVAVLLGDRHDLSLEIKQDFELSDTVHILAISGSNITITIGLLLLVFRRLFKRKVALIITLFISILYVLLLGATPSAVRGGLMGSIAILGILFGREYLGVSSLNVAALIMTLYQPRVLWDIGFDLSFLGTLGLFVIARPIEDKLHDWPPLVREGVALTIAAELTTLPLTMYYFHQLSFIAIFANLFGVPALELVLAFGFLTVLGGWLIAPLGLALGTIAGVFAAYLLGTVHFFAQLPFGHAIVPDFHPVWIGIYYIILTFGLMWWRGKPKYLQSWVRSISQKNLVRFGMLALLVLEWSMVIFK